MMSLGDPEGHPYSTVEGNLKMVYFRLAYSWWITIGSEG